MAGREDLGSVTPPSLTTPPTLSTLPPLPGLLSPGADLLDAPTTLPAPAPLLAAAPLPVLSVLPVSAPRPGPLPELRPADPVRPRPRPRRRTAHDHWSTSVVLGSVSGLLGVVALVLLQPGAAGTSLVALGLLWTTLVALTPGHVGRAAVVLGAGSWALSTLTVPPVSAPRLLVFCASVTLAATALGWLLDVRRAARTTRVVVVGSEAAVRTTLAQLDVTPDHGLEVTGACLTGAAEAVGGLGVPTGVGLEQLTPLLEDAEAVLALPGPELQPKVLRTLGWQLDAAGTQLLVGTGLVGLGRSRTRDARAGEIGLLHVRPVGRGGPGRLVKGAWERTAALLALVVLAPALLLLVLAVRLDSPGPGIFRQARVGREGRAFTIFKLRTMTVDSEHLVADLRAAQDVDLHPLFKLARDPRVTRLGAWLRRYSLDELPQLANVVLGDMSLVGPRPALPHEVQGYGAYPRRRLSVKPGLTGLWQVSGRSDLTWDDAVRLDLDYVDNWSLLRDLTIIARTFGVVLTHRGAY